jgi:hypothetical protein
MKIYAWIGEDELGSGKVGLKQALVPAGLIPIVGMDYHFDKIRKLYPQMEEQAAKYGRKIYLCEFEFTGRVVMKTESGTPSVAESETWTSEPKKSAPKSAQN